MWVLKFVGGLVAGWIFLGVILTKGFWVFLFHLIFGGKSRVPEETIEEEELEPPRPQPAKSVEDDLSKMSREELAELLRTSEVRMNK
jgi:hypothetical protein